MPLLTPCPDGHPHGTSNRSVLSFLGSDSPLSVCGRTSQQLGGWLCSLRSLHATLGAHNKYSQGDMAEYFRCSEQSMHIQGNPSVSRAAVSVRGPSSPSAAGAQLIPSRKGERSSMERSHTASQGLGQGCSL